jgi:hypothetical protein
LTVGFSHQKELLTMVSSSEVGTSPNQKSEPGDLSSIRGLPVDRRGDDSRRLVSVLLISWVCSAVIHAVLLVLFLTVTVNVGAAPTMELEIIQARVDDSGPRDENLTNDEIGDNPEQLLTYDTKRIEDVSVPGPTMLDEAVGLKNAPESTPINIPPPPGLGDKNGQGGGIEALKPGLASPIGAPGGMMKGVFGPGGFGGRSGATRQQLLTSGGGNTESEACVAAGLKWLVAHQAPDGHWSLDGFNRGRCNCNGYGEPNDIAATAFGLLPLLGAGETHKEPKATYKHNVERALKYLIARQARDGYFGGKMYAHGLATIAICEAYGMTSDPTLKAPAQRALNFIRAAQSDGGGWRYEPREAGDTSVTGWQIMALKSGQMAGLEVDDSRNPTLSRASRFLNTVMTADQTGYGYQSPQDLSGASMTAVGLLCRLYLGTGPRNTGIQGGVQRLKQYPPSPVTTARNIYYDYYATQVMHHIGGESWEFWNPKIRNLLVKTQDKGLDPKHPHMKGSWSPTGDLWGGTGGRIMTTSLSILTLEVYYRHLPLYRRDMAAKAAPAE